MRHWRAFSALCGYLRSGVLAGGPRGKYPLVSWQRLIETGKAHCVMPALSWCLRQDPTVPPELRSYLDAVLRLNGKRNERLCNTLEHVIGALNAIDIEPTLLKGAAHLVGGLYPAPAARLIGDLDVLIPQERARDAVAAMERIGFAVGLGQWLPPETHHHLPQMRHTETNIVIELHTRLLHWATDPIVPISWVREQSRLISFRGLRVKTLEPTVLIGHNVVHDQLNHGRYQWKQVELRQLLDLALIRARHEKEIDWAELDRRFSNVGLSRVLATYLRYNEALFGQPMPTVGSAPRARAISRLRRAMEDPPEQRRARRAQSEEQRRARREQRRARRQRWARKLNMLARLPNYYINARRRDPRGLVRLFDPGTWLRGFRVIWRALKETS